MSYNYREPSNETDSSENYSDTTSETGSESSSETEFEETLNKLLDNYKKYLNNEIPNFKHGIFDTYNQYDEFILNFKNYLDFKKIKYTEYGDQTIDNVLYTYLYFGKFIFQDPDYALIYTKNYFIWELPGDENLKKASSNELITRENFSKYKKSFFHGWSKEQKVTFFKNNIFKELVSNLNINIMHPRYLECINGIFNIDYIIKKFIDNDFNSINSYDITYFKNCISRRQVQIKNKIKKNIKTIKENMLNNKSKRFKWENLCNVFNNEKIDIEDLREIAALYKIPFYNMMTKREICKELATIVIQSAKDISKNIDKCSNNESIFTLESLKEIEPEFFYSYVHNNRVYCDDIRSLYQYFIIDGNTKYPLDRLPVSKKLLKLINYEYNHLKTVTNTMEDLNVPYTPPSKESTLSRLTTDFTSLLNYPNDANYFKNSSMNIFNGFLQLLVNEELISLNEYRQINKSDNLIDKKINFLNIIVLKIKNDPDQIQTSQGVLSTLAINISNVYNYTFNGNDSDTESPSSESPSSESSPQSYVPTYTQSYVPTSPEPYVPTNPQSYVPTYPESSQQSYVPQSYVPTSPESSSSSEYS